MKKIISNILILFLSAIVLISSVSFTVERHLCDGKVFSESFFGEAKKSGMVDDYCIALHSNHSLSQKSCCKDKIQLINGSVFEKESILKLKNKQQQNLIIFNLISYSSFPQ